MVTINKHIAVFFLFISLCAGLKAGNETSSDRLNEPQLSTPGTVLQVNDNKFNGLLTWNSNFIDIANTVTIEFGLNENLRTVHSSFSSTITFDVILTDASLVSTVQPAQSITINYEPNGEYIDKAQLTWKDFYQVSISNITITTTSGTTTVSNPADLYLDAKISSERLYTFSTGLSVVSNTLYAVTGNELEVKWDYAPGYEEFELEWTFVDRYSPVTGIYKADTQINYDLDHDATRIVTPNNYYRIPLSYDNGYIIYRVRPVGKDINGRRLEGQWQSIPPSGTVAAALSFSNLIVAVAAYQPNYNWSSTKTFSEDGKMGTGIDYSDGALMVHQSLARLNTEEKAIVHTTLYDHYGRTRISTIPAPVANKDLYYRTQLNMIDIGGGPVEFDKTIFDDCNISCSGASFQLDPVNSTGATNYFSPNNPDQAGANTYIPNANGYAYAQVEYTPDQSGRISSTTIPGSVHTLGSGKQTDYYYSNPTQVELDRLFGSEAGRARLYTKNYSKDANGQTTTSYLDPYDRVVATALVGDEPASLEAIPDKTTIETLQDDLVAYSLLDSVNYCITVNSSIFVSGANDQETYSYSAQLGTFIPEECQNICLKCVYQLDISIKDECGVEYFDHDRDAETPPQAYSGTIGPVEPYVSDCENPNPPFIDFQSPVTIVFPHVGNYTVYKKICVSNKPEADYVRIFREEPTCKRSLCTFFDSIIGTRKFTDCEPSCDDCQRSIREYQDNVKDNGPETTYYPPLTPEELADLQASCEQICDPPTNVCDYYKMRIRSDFMPDGTFGATSSADPSWSNSIFNPLNNLHGPTVGVHYTWQNPPPQTTTYYYHNSDGSQSTVTIAGVVKNPEQLTMAEFITYWKDSWAETFMKLHPEYCKLDFYCNVIGSSVDYDDAIKHIDEFDEACAAGFLDPIAGQTYAYGPLGICLTGSSYDPLFQSPPAILTGTMQTQFINSLQNYNGSGNTVFYEVSNGLGLTPPASGPYFGNDPCGRDQEWQKYRDIYLGLKNSLYQSLLTAYNASNPVPPCYTLSGYTPMGTVDDYMNQYFGVNTGSSSSTVSTTASANLTTQCHNTCASYAASWIQELSLGCNFGSLTTTQQNNMITDLTAVCELGCDAQHPMGSSDFPTTVTGYHIPGSPSGSYVHSFQEVLNYYFPVAPAAGNCSAYTISQPPPYGYTGLGSAVMSSCGCDNILQADYDFTNNINVPAGVIKARQLFALRYGYDLKNFNFLKCACNKATTQSGGWSPGYVWTQPELDALEASQLPAPAGMKCESCISCKPVSDIINTLYAQSGSSWATVFDYANSSNNQNAILNGVNQQLNSSLTYTEILGLLRDCASFNSTSSFAYTLSTEAADVQSLLNGLSSEKLLTKNRRTSLCTDISFYTSNLYEGDLPAVTAYDYVVSQTATTLTIEYKDPSTSAVVYSIVLTAPGSVSSINWSALYGLHDLQATVPGTPTAGPQYTFQLNGYAYGVGMISGITGTCSWPIAYLSNAYPHVPSLCPPKKRVNECKKLIILQAMAQAQALYNTYLDAITNAFIAKYKMYCYKSLQESFERVYKLHEYHYTLYYYDEAGNLQRTVSPNGVDLLPLSAPLPFTTILYPAHSSSTAVDDNYVNNYEFNSYNQELKEHTADGGLTTFFYDLLGRSCASQNGDQVHYDAYSYALYDQLGRIIEVGEATNPPQLLSDAIVEDPVAFNAWINGCTRSEVIQTYFDEEITSIPAFTSGQQNLRNRISSVTLKHLYNPGILNYDNASHYSYDEHGNLLELIEENTEFANSLATQQFKTIFYEYELISGNVKKITYQKDQADLFIHTYTYDADNRLHEVFTSRDGKNFERDAKYFYYQHGPLARVERGDAQVQGEDYFYTIQGWLKGMNSNSLAFNTDPGKDANRLSLYSNLETGIHQFIAADAASFNLNYFDSDYSSIATLSAASTSMAVNVNPIGSKGLINPGAGPFSMSSVPQLYNGAISSMVTTLTNMGQNNITPPQQALPQITAYQYDQLYRLTQMKAYWNYNINANRWRISSTTNTDDSYQMNLQYDPNGNIIHLTRMGASSLVKFGSIKNMDDLSYSYITNRFPQPVTPLSVPRNTNQLFMVSDNYGFAQESDIDDQTSLGTYNYQYNDIGSLVTDKSEHIAVIEWTMDRKVKRVIRDGGTKTTNSGALFYPSDLEFRYNTMRQRSMKIEKPRDQTTGALLSQLYWKYTYYTYDVTGNVLAVYEKNFVPGGHGSTREEMKLKELDIYGQKRLGIFNSDLSLESRGFTAETAELMSDYKFLGGIGYVNEEIFINMVYGPATIPPHVNTFVTGTQRVLGSRSYEISNHLDNVFTVISDRKTGVDDYNAITGAAGSDGLIDWYKSEILSTTDYYPFGQSMPGRQYVAKRYSYGMNGAEKDDEFTGTEGSIYNTHYREYDARLGRWFAKDPITMPFESPYAGMGNNPISFSDPLGDKIKFHGFKNWARIQYKKLTDKNFRKEFKALKAQYKEKVKDSHGNDTKKEKVLHIKENANKSNHTLDEAVENHETDKGTSGKSQNERGEEDYLYYNGNLDKITVSEQEYGKEYSGDIGVNYGKKDDSNYDLIFHGDKDNFDHWNVKQLTFDGVTGGQHILDPKDWKTKWHVNLKNIVPDKTGGDGNPKIGGPTNSSDHSSGGWSNGSASYLIEAFGKPRIYSVERKFPGIWDHKTKKDLPDFSGKTDRTIKREVRISVFKR
ncbi:MAG: hypothetical protein K0S33_443 [Bacteroidetes bacterium]|jgi:RHS repeat-associated protein|nr:hypothetical protein [Bacteroidota bacterium]